MKKFNEYIGLNISTEMKEQLDDEVKKTGNMFASTSHLIRFIISEYFSIREKK